MVHVRRRYALAALLPVLLLIAADAPKTRYIQPSDVDYKSLLAAPPVDGSAEQLAEIDQLLHLQSQRTGDQAKRCDAEEPSDVFLFASVLGKGFNAHDLPVTGELLKNVYADTNKIVKAAKATYNRKRPYDADSRIKPCAELESSASYPSGHATRGIAAATILSQLFPEKQKELMALGKQIGDDRALAGVHYPSDVAAGQKLGAAIADKIIASPEFQADLEKARAECKALHQ